MVSAIRYDGFDGFDGFDLVKLLLKHGANPDASERNGNSCFHLAVTESDELTFQALLERGANMGTRGFLGDSVLHWAARWNNADALRVLLLKHKDQGTLHDALEARNNNGCTALHHAASDCFNVSTVNLLLDFGASVEVTQENGDTPLHAAMEAVRSTYRGPWFDTSRVEISETCQMIVALLDAGADPRVENTVGITPLALTINAPQFEAIHGMKSWHAEQKSW